MIRNNFSWFQDRARMVWESDPGKSLLVIVPKGCNENTTSNNIEKYVQNNFILQLGDEEFVHKVFKITADTNESSDHFINNFIKLFEKCLGKRSSAHDEEYLSDKIEAAIDELNNQNIHPILLVNRFHSFASIQDRALTSTLGKLREMEHDKKLTSIVISPINYDVLRREMANNPGAESPFINSPYGDNHEKIIIEPLTKDDFISYATGRGINQLDAEFLYSLGGGPDDVYENLVKNKKLGVDNFVQVCAEECASVFEKFFKNCELSGKNDLLNRLAQNSLNNRDQAYLASIDLKNFIIHSKDQSSYKITSQIMKEHILTKTLLAESDNILSVFDKSVETLVAMDENQEIEFKSSLLGTKKLDEKGNQESKHLGTTIALKEITGFLNSNDGVLLIGVIDGKNTTSGKPQISGIDSEMHAHNMTHDEYKLHISQLIQNGVGATAGDLISVTLKTINNKTVCRIHIKKSPEAVYLKKLKGMGDLHRDAGNYIRRDSSTEIIPADEWIKWVKQKFEQ